MAGKEIMSQVPPTPTSANSQDQAGPEIDVLVELELNTPSPVSSFSSEERKREGLFAFLYFGLMSHHCSALFPFCWTLASHEMSGICLFGLMYEIPVLLLNLRDLFVSFEVELFPQNNLWRRDHVVRFWLCFHILWHSTRSLSCLLYVVSLFVWRESINSLLSPASRVVYHVLGGLFNYINIVLLCSVIPLYMSEDLKRCRKPQQHGKLSSVLPVLSSNAMEGL